MNKVCDIVRTQLALAPEIQLTPESKFSELGADSLDTVSPFFVIYPVLSLRINVIDTEITVGCRWR